MDQAGIDLRPGRVRALGAALRLDAHAHPGHAGPDPGVRRLQGRRGGQPHRLRRRRGGQPVRRAHGVGPAGPRRRDPGRLRRQRRHPGGCGPGRRLAADVLRRLSAGAAGQVPGLLRSGRQPRRRRDLRADQPGAGHGPGRRRAVHPCHSHRPVRRRSLEGVVRERQRLARAERGLLSEIQHPLYGVCGRVPVRPPGAAVHRRRGSGVPDRAAAGLQTQRRLRDVFH